MGLYVLVGVVLVVVAMLLLMSLTNFSTIRLDRVATRSPLERQLAPAGSEQVKSFEPIEIGDSDVSRLVGRSFAGRESATRPSSVLHEQATAEVNKAIRLTLAKWIASYHGRRARDQEGSGMAGPRFELAQKRVPWPRWL